MNYSGATERIFRFANTVLGRSYGGLGHVNIVASKLFSGMSESAVAADLGAIEIKAMKEQGYDPGFASAVTAASSTIGPIIPLSVAVATGLDQIHFGIVTVLIPIIVFPQISMGTLTHFLTILGCREHSFNGHQPTKLVVE